MKKTFKNQLPVFIPECILFITCVTFAVLLLINSPFAYNFITGNREPMFQVKGSMIDLVLATVSACVVAATSIACICMGHLFKHKDPVKWLDKGTFVSGVIFLAYDLAMVGVMFGLLLKAGVLPL